MNAPHLQRSGISYEWDLLYNIKDRAAARKEYKRMQARLADLPAALAHMKELARRDGFTIS